MIQLKRITRARANNTDSDLGFVSENIYRIGQSYDLKESLVRSFLLHYFTMRKASDSLLITWS